MAQRVHPTAATSVWRHACLWSSCPNTPARRLWPRDSCMPYTVVRTRLVDEHFTRLSSLDKLLSVLHISMLKIDNWPTWRLWQSNISLKVFFALWISCLKFNSWFPIHSGFTWNAFKLFNLNCILTVQCEDGSHTICVQHSSRQAWAKLTAGHELRCPL